MKVAKNAVEYNGLAAIVTEPSPDPIPHRTSREANISYLPPPQAPVPAYETSKDLPQLADDSDDSSSSSPPAPDQPLQPQRQGLFILSKTRKFSSI